MDFYKIEELQGIELGDYAYTVKVGYVLESGSWVVLSILDSDTGEEVDPEYLDLEEIEYFEQLASQRFPLEDKYSYTFLDFEEESEEESEYEELYS